jgi:hypothetical protein
VVKGLWVAVGVVTDRHLGGQFLADQGGIPLDLAADDKEGGWCLSLGEDSQDLGGGMGPGAVVEGERHR